MRVIIIRLFQWNNLDLLGNLLAMSGERNGSSLYALIIQLSGRSLLVF